MEDDQYIEGIIMDDDRFIEGITMEDDKYIEGIAMGELKLPLREARTRENLGFDNCVSMGVNT